MVNQVSHLQSVGASAAKFSKGIGNARHLTSHFTMFCTLCGRNPLKPRRVTPSEFSCATTKTTALVTHALPVYSKHAVSDVLPDGGNDNFENGMMVRFWDSKLDKIDILDFGCTCCEYCNWRDSV